MVVWEKLYLKILKLNCRKINWKNKNLGYDDYSQKYLIIKDMNYLELDKNLIKSFKIL